MLAKPVVFGFAPRDWRALFPSRCCVFRLDSCPFCLLRSPTWGDGVQSTDWKAAVLRATPVVLAANPDLIIFVDGLQYSTDFTGALDLMCVYSFPSTQPPFPS